MIECRGVSFSYDGAVSALDGVDLNIEDGEFFCILGGNGSGKSTFAKHLNALLQPDAGTVRINGMDASDPELVYDIRSTAGMVFQNPDDQLVATLVEDDVAFGPENLGVPSAQIAQRVREALKGVGLVGFERHETHALSGGQKQRVALAGVLAMEPRVLILDEASSMLDPRGRKGLMKACRALHDRGMTIVMITHFMEEAAEADRVAVFQTGRVAMLGTPEEILTRANELAQLNLDMPESCRLGTALRAKGVPVHAQVREAGMVAEVVETYAERSGAGTVGQSSAPQSEIVGGTVSAGNEDNVPEPVIELSHVSYSYSLSPRERRRWHKRSATADKSNKQALWGNDPSSPWALRDVSLTVRRGEFLGLAGHTGSGKSTLVQMLNGLMKPTSGQVLLDGVDIWDKPKEIRKIRFKVGMVFQYPEYQLFEETVYKDISFGPFNKGLSQEEIDKEVRRAAKFTGIKDELLYKSPFDLSGGEKRRAAIAGVIAMDPDVLVLDEPTAGLDPMGRDVLLSQIVRYHKERQNTVLLVSHSMEDIARVADRIVVMNKSKLVMFDKTQKVFARGDELEKIGLRIPQITKIMSQLRKRGVDVPEGILTVDSAVDYLLPLIKKEAR